MPDSLEMKFKAFVSAGSQTLFLSNSGTYSPAAAGVSLVFHIREREQAMFAPPGSLLHLAWYSPVPSMALLRSGA